MAPLSKRFSGPLTHSVTLITVALGLLPLFWPQLALSSGARAAALAAGFALMPLLSGGVHWAEGSERRWAKSAYLTVALGVSTVLLLSSKSYAWISVMPLLSHAVLLGSMFWGAGLSLIVAGVTVYPYWEEPMAMLAMRAVGVLSAMLFVLVFSELARRQVAWRTRVEELSRGLEVAHAELKERSQSIAELSERLERLRLAREMHDGLGHYLTSIVVQAEAAGAFLESDPARAQDSLRRAQELARAGLDDLRHQVLQLRSSAEADGRELPAILAELAAQAGHPEVGFQIAGTARVITPAHKHALLRAAHEGVTNALKHAAAQRIELCLSFLPDRLRLTVSDDGQGPQGGTVGYGLIGIQERIEILGGTFAFGPGAARGARLEVEIYEP
jgi:signal transduction histidine kinase